MISFLQVLSYTGVFLLTVIVFKCFPRFYKIEGDSMYPTLKNGSYIVAMKLYKPDPIVPGNIYVFKSPENHKKWLIKRLDYYYSAGSGYFFIGDNRNGSRDSRHFGLVPRDLIISRVIYYKDMKGDSNNGKRTKHQ